MIRRDARTLSQVSKICPKQLQRLLPILANIAYIFLQKEPQHHVLDYEAYWKDEMEDRRAENPTSIIYWQEKEKVFDNIIENDTSVLDIGCGNGEFLSRLRKLKKIQPFGIDISTTAISKAKGKGIRAKVVDIMDASFELKDIYDYITVIDVLEHIQDPEILLEKLQGKFRKKLIVSFQNSGYFTHRLRLLFGSFPKTHDVHPREHIRFWTLRDFRWWNKINNHLFSYTIEKMHPTMGVPILRSLFPSLFALVLFVELTPVEKAA